MSPEFGKSRERNEMCLSVKERERQGTNLSVAIEKEGQGVCLCVKDNRQRVEEEEVPPGGRVCGFMLFDST